jgi:hypothetical protein
MSHNQPKKTLFEVWKKDVETWENKTRKNKVVLPLLQEVGYQKETRYNTKEGCPSHEGMDH